MDPMGEEQFKDVDDLDAARLALRGALATIRDLQDLSSRLKGDLQEAAHKERAASQAAEELKSQLEEWQGKAKAGEEERKSREEHLRRFKDAIRLEVRDEERSRIAEERRRSEEQIAGLAAALQDLRRLHAKKEEEWQGFRRLLEEREAELLRLQREKVELSNRYHQDAEMLQRLRGKRDEEISAMLRDRAVELEEKDRRIRELERKNEEFAKILAAQAQEADLRAKEREELLIREYRAKSLALEERYAKREAELQSAWADLEGGLWGKLKEQREKLDQAAQGQLEARARALADRSQELESRLEARRLELEEEARVRIESAERQHAEKERRMLEDYARREARLLKRFEVELAKEKASAQEAAAEAESAREAEHRAGLLEVERRKQALSLELERGRQALEAEFSQREAQSQLRWQEKERVLEEAFQKRRLELQDEALRKESQLQEEWAARRGRWLQEQAKGLEAEKTILQARFEAATRGLEEAGRARVAELDRSHAALQEQYQAWKAALQDEHLRREKDLDKRWFIREQELTGKYEAALEAQRRDAQEELARLRERFEEMRRSRGPGEGRGPGREGA